MDNYIQKFLDNEFKDFLKFKWNLSIDLLFVVFVYLAIFFTIYIAFQVITTVNLILNFILFSPVCMLLLGVLIPIYYHSFLKGRPLAVMGIKKEYWLISLVLSILFGIVSYFITIANIVLPPFEVIFPLILMTIALGLFETIFFRGWLQLRFEDAFGSIPSIIIGAVLYSLYHVGFGVTLSVDLWLLFLIGLISAIIFRITRNILILWPFYIWIDSLYIVVLGGFKLPFNYSYGFLIIIASIIAFILFIYFKKPEIR